MHIPSCNVLFQHHRSVSYVIYFIYCCSSYFDLIEVTIWQATQLQYNHSQLRHNLIARYAWDDRVHKIPRTQHHSVIALAIYSPNPCMCEAHFLKLSSDVTRLASLGKRYYHRKHMQYEILKLMYYGIWIAKLLSTHYDTSEYWVGGRFYAHRYACFFQRKWYRYQCYARCGDYAQCALCFSQGSKFHFSLL